MCLTGYAQAQQQSVRAYGSISSIYRDQSSGESGINSSNWLNIAKVSASSYIWHPWFALIDGSLTLSAAESENNFGDSSESDTISGSFQFRLFPTSRFPFLLYASKSQFEQDSTALNGRVFSQTTVGMRQSYTAPDGRQSYFAAYQRQDRDNQVGNDESTETFNLGANARFEDHNFSSNLSHSSVFEPSAVRDDSDTAFNARHSYIGSSELSLENQLSAAQFSNKFSSIANDIKTQQFTSFAAWAPNNSKDLNVTGNLRVAQREQTFINTLLTDQSSQTVEQTGVNLNQGLIYRINSNLSFQQAVNINLIQQAGGDTVNYVESVGVNYSSDTINLSDGDYNWFAGSSLNNQHGDVTQSNVLLSTQLGHNYSTQYYINPAVALQANYGQNLNYASSNRGDNSGNLGNAFSLSWSHSRVQSKTSMRLSATDSRSLDDDDNTQLFDIQLNQYNQFDRFTTVGTNLSFQRSRNSSFGVRSGVRSISGQVTYTNQRFLNTQGLIFKSLLKASDTEPDDAELFNPDTQDSNSLTWENELFYRVGLFESRLSFDYIKTEKDFNQIIIIELTRHFGDI